MKFLEKLYGLVNGNKTYVVGLATIVYAILGLVLGLHDSDRASNLLIVGLLAITGKSALKKLE